MKQIFRYFLVIILLVFSSAYCNSQTMHAIVFCNTIDESIGQSMSIELKNMTNQVRLLNNLIDYDMDIHVLDGNNCTRNNLKLVIDQLDVDENDIIFTFYGGHGSHAENNESDPWPQYCMNTGFENQSNWVPMALLAKWVKAKNPRLAVIISNCCNVVQKGTTIKPLWAMGGDYTKLDGIDVNKYKQLFGAKGIVMVTSSKVPEPSWCCVPDGGLFTCDFIQTLKMVGTGAVSPDWNAVLQKTYELCSSRNIIDVNGQYHKQHPYFEVNLKDGNVEPYDNDRNKRSTDPLEQALLDIVNKNIDQSNRLAMIPKIMSKYFASFDKVMTVGTDLETVVDYEDPQDFLRRICLSPYIKQVNIINKQSGVLTVHEIRVK